MNKRLLTSESSSASLEENELAYRINFNKLHRIYLLFLYEKKINMIAGPIDEPRRNIVARGRKLFAVFGWSPPWSSGQWEQRRGDAAPRRSLLGDGFRLPAAVLPAALSDPPPRTRESSTRAWTAATS